MLIIIHAENFVSTICKDMSETALQSEFDFEKLLLRENSKNLAPKDIQMRLSDEQASSSPTVY